MKPPSVKVEYGDCRAVLPTLGAGSVQCCVTSPPYWGLRDYGHSDQLGQEATPEAFIENLVTVFREVRRVLADDGTLWLNLGDSYCSQGGSNDGRDDNQPGVGAARAWRNGSGRADGVVDELGRRNRNGNTVKNLKPKDLVGTPWRVALALQANGWWLRQDIIWHKPNPMPESVTDRCTKAHEYIFLLSKSARYYFDHEAIKEPPSPDLLKQIAEGYNGTATKDFAGGMAQDASATKARIINGYRKRVEKQRGHSKRHDGFNDRWDNLSREEQMACGSNKRDVWTVAVSQFDGAHFATFPAALIRPCILAGCPLGGTVLDPFGGTGTTGMVAYENGRSAVLIELNRDYEKIINQRLDTTAGLPLVISERESCARCSCARPRPKPE